MKKNLISLSLLLFIMLIFLHEKITAQDWHVAGNNLAGGEKLGSLNNFDLRIFTDNIQRIRVRGTTGNGFVGIGNSFSTPENTLHVFKGSAGLVTAHSNAPLVVENSTHCYLNLLAPNANETGILFGKPASNVSGGILFNNPALPNGLQFRIFNNSTRMQLTNEGVLQLLGGTDVNAANGGFLIAGFLSGLNIGIDNNEIMARNNGAVTDLFLNHEGGNVLINDLNATGNVGIGTPSPGNRLHVKQKIANRAIELQHESTSDFWTIGIGTNTHNFRFEFNGTGKADISSVDGAYNAFSDARLKQDIQPMSKMLDKVMQLKPSTYYFKDTRSFAKNKSMGFIAQEVEKVFPELVREDKDAGGYKKLNYADFTVIAIKAIQELQPIVEEQKLKIATLEDRIAKLEAALSANSIAGRNETAGASLYQNYPNPFSQSTTIRYKIPAGANAQIMIYDAKGTLVKSLRATESGQAQINASELSAGSYTYSLLINGKVGDSKKMVLTR